MLVVYCQKRKKKADKKARKKNKVGSESDSDIPQEPIVVHGDGDYFGGDASTHNNVSSL